MTVRTLTHEGVTGRSEALASAASVRFLLQVHATHTPVVLRTHAASAPLPQEGVANRSSLALRHSVQQHSSLRSAAAAHSSTG